MSGFLSGLLSESTSGLGPWAANLQPASFRGVPFAVKASMIKAGRRVAIHEYPFRDDVWVEDLGRGTTAFSFSAFLIGDDVFGQRDDFLDACDVPGAGLLVHPSVGSMQATNVSVSVAERADLGRVVELELMFIRGPNLQLSPVLTDATQFLTTLRSAAMLVASTVRFVTRVAVAIQTGNIGALVGQFVQVAGVLGFGAAGGTLAQFGLGVVSVLSDARMVYGAVSGLVGVFGRFAGGSLTTAQPATATAHSLLIDQTAQNEAALAAVAAAQLAMQADPSTAAPAVNAMFYALVGAVTSPADQIRLLALIAQTQIAISPGSSGVPIMQGAVRDLCVQNALAALANATSVYQPTSYNDAVAVRRLVCGLLGTGAVACADQGDTATYLAMKSLQAAVGADLTTRGARLPTIVTVTRSAPLPSLKLAYDLYADATRADDLTERVNPQNPAFFPTTFQALAE